jgi:hypothetical protein
MSCTIYSYISNWGLATEIIRLGLLLQKADREGGERRKKGGV